MPGVRLSLLLITAGAILAYAVDIAVSGVQLYTVVGGLGLLVSLLFWTSFAPFGSGRHQDDIEPHARY